MNNNQIQIGDIKLVNLTPHTITIQLNNGENVSISGCNNPIRIAEEQVLVYVLADIPIWKKKFTKLNFDVPQEDGTYYLVSLPVAQAIRRPDMLVVNDVVRDNNGNVLYARSLAYVEDACYYASFRT